MMFKVFLGLIVSGAFLISQAGAIAQPICKTVTYTPPTAKQAFVGDLCLPKNQKTTIILLVHGGGGVSGNKERLAPWEQEFNRAGYPTLAINYRLISHNEPKAVFPQPVQNVKSAIQYLRKSAKQLGIDSNRIIVMGSSAGATLAAQVLVSADDSYYQGGELWQNVSDRPNGVIAFYGNYRGSTVRPTLNFGGSADSPDPQVQERIRRANAILNASQSSAPVLLFHGTNDRLVAYNLMTQFTEALQRANKDVEAVTITGGIHGFDRNAFNRLSPIGKDNAQQIFNWLNRKFPEQ